MLKTREVKKTPKTQKRGFKNHRGSVTIEATITFSISLFLLIIAVGTVFSILINERMHQIGMEVTGKLQNDIVTYFDMNDVIKREAAEYKLEVSAINTFNDKLREQHMDTFVSIRSLDSHIKSKMDEIGVFQFVFC